ncbi:type III-B CRISPR module RAMP protein Cmr4 [Hydrogenivirga sp. 128-5-R1-1]|uniref:type III-B CRISPR module RAMP protein Cmr4 n=1 Tax=Hydrogenivirga sp. 128-5-R1-1 TaxID=392423 RepID=UPI00015EFF2B|nr:type III-B CRISPR module RAMP protein Cmr4 [Hydrogenivirga sp. 128-5-R1-1]EDP73928.1 hypothetical protein HG1285_07228 [Hydrogenivirga sp. 128-5-R1-1]
MSKKIAFYHCHTPLHIGSGTTLDIIDLPVQRESHTDFPVMPSSSIKGVIRAEYGLKEVNFSPENFPEKPEACPENVNQEKCKEFFNLFGHGEHEGDIIFTDGKILLFPVKSVKGVFVWITSPFVIDRFKRDTGIDIPFNREALKNKGAVVSSEEPVISNKYLVLEELSFEAEIDNSLKNSFDMLELDIDPKRIAVLSDDSFRYFVKNHTEVNARTRIDQAKGTVKEGALWYEELVPAETVFYNLIFSRTENKENINNVADFINNKIFQFGGDETLGRGFTKVSVLEGKNE